MVHYFGQIEQPAAIFLGMYDGYIVDKDGNYGLDREKAVAALNKMQSLLQYNPEGVLGFDFNGERVESGHCTTTAAALTSVCSTGSCTLRFRFGRGENSAGHDHDRHRADSARCSR